MNRTYKTTFLLGGLFFIMTTLNATSLTKLQNFMAAKVLKSPLENIPSIGLKFSADPAVLVYNDTVYIYATNDAMQAEDSLGNQDNNYSKICNLNLFSSKDLVNWTDLGEIPVGGKQNPRGAAKWANNSWAPAICCKQINGKDKFFLYFADSANGIGVLSADSPEGPFIDPIGKPLVSRNTKNCGPNEVYWLFDPAVIVDDDGTGYLYFGGGVEKDTAHPKSARVAKLNDDMISFACDPIEIDAPWLFEDSGINKFGNTYYYSYCANWSDRTDAIGDVPPTATIAYMTSENPLGPFKYEGFTLQNPGTYFGPWGNNHHWIFTFKGKNYIAYHAQIVEKQIGFSKGGYRNICISDFEISSDGKFPIQKVSKTGVSQVQTFNPYEKVPASTMHSSKNIGISSNQTAISIDDKSYILIKGADLSKGINKITIESLSKTKSDKTVKFYIKNMTSENLVAEIKADSGQKSVSLNKKDIPETADLYLVLSKDVELVNWQFN